MITPPENRENAYASLLTGVMILLISTLAFSFCSWVLISFIRAVLSNNIRIANELDTSVLTACGAFASCLIFGKGIIYSLRMISAQFNFLKRAG